MKFLNEMEHVNAQLNKCLDKYGENSFAPAEAIYWIGKFLNLYFYGWAQIFAASEPEIEEEDEWIKLRKFCEELIVDGKLVTYPGIILQYLRKYPSHFEGAFKQSHACKSYRVKKSVLLKKLVEFPHQRIEQHEAFKKYWEMEQKKQCPTQAIQQHLPID